MQSTWTWNALVVFVMLILSVHSQQFTDEDNVIESLLLRRLRRGLGPPADRTEQEMPRFVDIIIEPKRYTRNHYTPTPCRWKLCASLFGY
uniref:Conotoxin n=1 Tax=Bursaphelenchus xylophilus TaxID=6326 RepID=A0A1I7SUJ0_BURXY